MEILRSQIISLLKVVKSRTEELLLWVGCGRSVQATALIATIRRKRNDNHQFSRELRVLEQLRTR